MKTLKKNIYGLAAAVIAVTGLGACSNALDAPSMGGGNNTVNLTTPVTAPDVVAWTGNQVLGNTFNGTNYSVGTTTRSADVNGNLWYQNWERPTNVTEAEISKVLEEASKARVGVVNDLHIDWNNYWVQQVYTGEATYVDGTGSSIGTGSSHMNHLLAYSNKVKEQTSWWPEAEFTLRDKYEYEDVYEHVNNFNNGSNNTVYIDDVTKEEFIGTTLMTDMYAEGVTNQFGYHNSTDSKNHFEYIILEIDGSYYVCFDFYATHPEGQDANLNMDVERDWIFNDWIVKISPAYPKGTNGDDTPGDEGNNGGNDNNGDDNDDDGDDNPGNTPDNNPGSGDNTGDNGNTGNNPGNGGTTSPAGVNEVEINLALLDVHTLPDGSNKYGVEDLVSKLSIHVRYPHDVQVVLPVPEKFYCDQDDLYILKDHYQTNGEPNWVYGGETHSVSYNINGNVVKLNVTYVSALNDTQITKAGEGYIMVTTEGINQAVIDYCRTNFGDGINFEVYNYYNRGNKYTTGSYQEITYDELQWKYLNRSYVNFDYNHTGIIPDFYINAFNSLDGAYNRGDCYVWIIGDEHANNNTGTVFLNDSFYTNIYSTYNQRSKFWNAYQGTHYNASPYNWIYTSKGVIGSAEPSKNAMPDNGSWPFSTLYLMER